MQFNHQTNEPNVVSHKVRLLGAASAISIDTDGGGDGITVSRTSAGLYKLTFLSNPGVFQGAEAHLGAATPVNLAGHTVIRDTYDATNYTLEFAVFNATPVAHDLAANEYLDITVDFKG